MKSNITLEKINKLLTDTSAVGNLNIPVSSIKLSSLDIADGGVFVAVPGAMVDGRNYILQACEAGAIAIIAEAKNITEAQLSLIKSLAIPYLLVNNLIEQLGLLASAVEGYPVNQLTVVAITGTNGKTSICQMSAEIISRVMGECGQVGTLGNGLVNHLKPTINTTSDPLTLHRTFKEIEQAGSKHVVMEVSSHALVQGRVNGIPIKIAVFSNLTYEHLDYHQNMKNYFDAKRKLFLDPNLEYAVINADDDYGQKLLADPQITAKKIAYTSQLIESKYNNVWGEVTASNIKYCHHGQTFYVQSPWGDKELHISLLADFNLSNSLAVIAVLGCLKIEWNQITEQMSLQQPIPGRMESFGGMGKPMVVVDYAHTPDALEKALKAIRVHCSGELWCVFGCGGNRDPGKRPMMALVAESNSDHLIITDDNPRNEDGNTIISDVLSGLKKAGEAIVERDRAIAIRQAIRKALPNDIILIAGKGHENYQLIRGDKLPHSDRDYVQQQLLELAS